jgi:hypothetical protein
MLRGNPMTRHVLLLGDSTFDNAAYVAGGPDVVQQLRERLPAGWSASLKAIDGAVVQSVMAQIERLPADASHLVISVGGNDALHVSAVLDESARTVAEALEKLSQIGDLFEADYSAMLDAVLGKGLPAAICTIYDPRYPEPGRRVAVAGLALVNDRILRQAFLRGLPILDLRLICDQDDDFANPIEPSAQGGAKIAAAIAELLSKRDFSRRRAEVFVRWRD